MGKVRNLIVKKTARQLVERFPGKFTTDFEQNKTSVKELVAVESKRLRNRIAGYVTRLKAIEAHRASAESMGPIAAEPSDEET